MIVNCRLVDTSKYTQNVELSVEESEKVKIEARWINNKVAFVNDNYFSCLVDLREYLEKNGLMILCNGARVDAYPSRMSLQMSRGRKLYILEKGLQANEEKLVDIFDSAPLDKVGSVNQQKKFYKEWIDSLG